MIKNFLTKNVFTKNFLRKNFLKKSSRALGVFQEKKVRSESFVGLISLILPNRMNTINKGLLVGNKAKNDWLNKYTKKHCPEAKYKNSFKKTRKK